MGGECVEPGGMGQGAGSGGGVTLKHTCLSCECGDTIGGMPRPWQSRRVVF